MGKTSKFKQFFVTLFPRIKNFFTSNIRNARTLNQKKKPEKLNATLGRKNEKRILKLVRSYNKSLAPLYKSSLEPSAVADEKMQRELRKFDMKQYWKYRQVNHAYALCVFSGDAQARQTHVEALGALAAAREEKVKTLTAQKDRYIAEQVSDESARQAAAQEYAEKLAAAQAEIDKTVEQLENERKERVEQMSRKCEEKIAQINGNAEELTIPDDVVLSVNNLCMYFGGLHAVEDLSFDVKQGEIFGLIGPNGAGKTTVFNCITQFYKCTAGEILFRNNENIVIDMKSKAVHDVILEGVARTFQNVEVIKEISVLENLLVAATRKYASNLAEQVMDFPILSSEEKLLKERALEILEYFDLLAYKDWLAWGLPYGILKKVEIARALMANPKLLILDEPAAGLNNTETAQLAKLISEIRDKFQCSVLLVEHDMSLVMSICDRICAISFGKKLALGTPAEIQANKQVQEAYLGVAEEA